jgi:starch phosphorylase
VQIVFAGKAHPATKAASTTCSRSTAAPSIPAFGGRIAFVDDYDLHVAHFLVQGCDVWLNNPRKPLEASGTSGMKASLNGVPHLSIGDGWWAEGYTGDNGWLIDAGDAGDHDAQDAADARSIYDLLEQEIVPAFYDRDNGIPSRWLAVVPQRIVSVAPRLQRAPHGQGLTWTRCTPPRCSRARRYASSRVIEACPVNPSRRSAARSATPRSLRAARRGEVLPRLLGQENRRRGNRRARVRAEALHPRAQRRRNTSSTTPR